MELHVQSPFWITRLKFTLWVCSFLGNMARRKPETQRTWRPSTERIAQSEKQQKMGQVSKLSQESKDGRQPDTARNILKRLLGLISKHSHIQYVHIFYFSTSSLPRRLFFGFMRMSSKCFTVWCDTQGLYPLQIQVRTCQNSSVFSPVDYTCHILSVSNETSKYATFISTHQIYVTKRLLHFKEFHLC